MDIEQNRMAKACHSVFDNMKALATSLGLFGEAIGTFYCTKGSESRMTALGQVFKEISAEVQNLCAADQVVWRLEV